MGEAQGHRRDDGEGVVRQARRAAQENLRLSPMTLAIAAIVAAAITAFAALLLPPLRRTRRRRRTLATPLTTEQRSLLSRNVRGAAAVPPELESRLEGLVNTFLEEKKF